MVAMVDLYYQYKSGKVRDLKKSLSMLSQKLIKRAEFLQIPHDEKYRNINGMHMIFENVRYVDTNGQEGLSGASTLVYEIIKLYKENPFIFQAILKEFNDRPY